MPRTCSTTAPGYEVASFVGHGADVLEAPSDGVDWVITDPAFNLALDFASRGLELASEEVALLVRSVWLEGAERYHKLFADRPPTIVAQFCERWSKADGIRTPRLPRARLGSCGRSSRRHRAKPVWC
jgi:hypothetical protein